jgi:hypothetical protein
VLAEDAAELVPDAELEAAELEELEVTLPMVAAVIEKSVGFTQPVCQTLQIIPCWRHCWHRLNCPASTIPSPLPELEAVAEPLVDDLPEVDPGEIVPLHASVVRGTASTAWRKRLRSDFTAQS